MTAPEIPDLARQRLYKERAEWAEFESEIAEGKKYFTVGGWAWKIAEFLDREAKEARAEIQKELDEMNHPEKWNSEDIAHYARMSMHVDDYADHHSNSDDLHDYYRHQDGKFPDAFQWRVAAGAVLVWLFIALFVAWVV